jgi:lipoyl-dependent peroxiredoxin
VVRGGRVLWRMRPPAGSARITVESHAFGPVTMSMTEAGTVTQQTAPGELLAVAHAALMATALAGVLHDAGMSASELVVSAHAGFTGPPAVRELVAVNLDVRGRLPGIEREAFEKAATAARTRYLRLCGTHEDLNGTLNVTLVD